MIIVTGGAGFIGSNIIYALNKKGFNNILVVDNIKKNDKFTNLVNLNISDFIDKKDFICYIKSNFLKKITAIFHEGACSSTTEYNGQYMMSNNYQYSKEILHYCVNNKIPFLYASSASVYGIKNKNFIEKTKYIYPANIYGYSKALFDKYVINILPKAKSPVCGIRYFNVYGPREHHKGNMASLALQIYNQINKNKQVKIFLGSDKFKRDFIYIDDAVKVNLWLWEHSKSGIFNCGTGVPESIKKLAEIIIKFYKKSTIFYIPIPIELKNHYQEFTSANLFKLRSTGYKKNFIKLNEGIIKYIYWLKKNKKHYYR